MKWNHPRYNFKQHKTGCKHLSLPRNLLEFWNTKIKGLFKEIKCHSNKVQWLGYTMSSAASCYYIYWDRNPHKNRHFTGEHWREIKTKAKNNSAFSIRKSRSRPKKMKPRPTTQCPAACQLNLDPAERGSWNRADCQSWQTRWHYGKVTGWGFFCLVISFLLKMSQYKGKLQFRLCLTKRRMAKQLQGSPVTLSEEPLPVRVTPNLKSATPLRFPDYTCRTETGMYAFLLSHTLQNSGKTSSIKTHENRKANNQLLHCPTVAGRKHPSRR